MKTIQKISLVLGLCFMIASCSMVKNPSASNNFKRVKYNSHLKLAKSNQEKAQQDQTSNFEIVEVSKSKQSLIATESLMKSKKAKQLKKVHPQGSPMLASIQPTGAEAGSNQKLLNNIKSIDVEAIQNENMATQGDKWWEADPEDWPFPQLILAAIAILLVILAIYLLIALIGVVVGSILGLILLLLVAYFIYQYMT